MIKQGTYETFVQYSEQLRETYYAYKAAEDPASPVVVTEPDQVMDFFHGLDQGKIISQGEHMEWVGSEVNETATATATIQEVIF
jgi:hypothetical protein